MLLCSGDFRQISPVVTNSHRLQHIQGSPRLSNAWRHFRQHTLKTSVRAAKDPAYDERVTALGNGTAPICGFTPLDHRPIVDVSFVETRFDENTKNDAVNFVFGDLDANAAILSPHNKQVRMWNEKVQQTRPGRARVYQGETRIDHESMTGAASEVDPSDDTLAAITENSTPDHTLELKLGDWVILTRTVDKMHDLVANTRLQLVEMWDHAIAVRKPPVKGRQDEIFNICRWRNLFPLQRGAEIEVARIQFPLRLAYAMSFNKAQGQTLDKVLVDLTTGGAFSHGHLYVALSRVRCNEDIALFVDDAEAAQILTPHVVYQGILRDQPTSASFPLMQSEIANQVLTIHSLRTGIATIKRKRSSYSGPIRTHRNAFQSQNVCRKHPTSEEKRSIARRFVRKQRTVNKRKQPSSVAYAAPSLSTFFTSRKAMYRALSKSNAITALTPAVSCSCVSLATVVESFIPNCTVHCALLCRRARVTQST